MIIELELCYWGKQSFQSLVWAFKYCAIQSWWSNKRFIVHIQHCLGFCHHCFITNVPCTLCCHHSQSKNKHCVCLALLQLKTNVLQCKSLLLCKVSPNLHSPYSRNIWPIKHLLLHATLHAMVDVICAKSKFQRHAHVGTALLLHIFLGLAWACHVYTSQLWPCMHALC